MAMIYSFRKKEEEIPDGQILSLFNQAVAFIFRPRPGRDPAIVVCELVARTIVSSRDNPHALPRRERLAELLQTG